MFKNSNGQVRAGWLILFAFIAVFIGQGILTAGGYSLLYLLNAPGTNSSYEGVPFTIADLYPWNSFVIYGGAEIGTILFTILIWCFVNKKPLHQLGIKWVGKDALFGFLLGTLSISMLFLILFATGLVELRSSLASPSFSIYTLITFLFYILVGVSEEIFFRGYIMSTMQERGNPKWLIYLVSAIIFSLMHGLNPNISVLGIINIALVGLLFAYMFSVTKNLWLPIGYHIAWNYFQGSIFGFAVSGTEPRSIYDPIVSNNHDWITGGTFGLEGGILTTLILIIGYVVTRIYMKFR
ncbi:CPBP family intramembrane metalloprotease [Aciduricibacillus chroicocephali]|uniref:CPBP family intramembrane metalloprotease n=1 Tax=Aciduricibacillus chroicocephali TaxID=3054939 RepID=A0ABY9KYE2_9BACI|nr:CPBP family intramembrane metalloprotease [Bacillaceae bacterium 44XB]